MRDEDYLISTYRSHGHALVRGTSPNNVMAELFGRVDGCSHGRGGSMHMFDLERRFMGGYGIVGGNLPIAAGLGLGADMQGTQDATLCQFGDGAANQGTFGEALNLAALWKLPVVFMVTNNQFGMGTALARHSAVTDLHKRGEGFGVPGHALRRHGRARHLHDVPSEALRRARDERTPAARRGDHLPLPRPLDGRPRGVPDEGAGRRVARARPDRRRSASASSTRACSATRTSSASTARRSPGSTRPSTFADASPHPEPESLYDDIYVLGGQVRGWYSVDERSAGVHRGEHEREMAEDGALREQFEQVVETQGGDVGGSGSGPSDASQDEGKAEEAPEEAQDTERAEA